MLFRPYDTNNEASVQPMLGLSPPTKRCDKSPSKVPMDSDLIFHADSDDQGSCFQFDLQTVQVAPSSDREAQPLRDSATPDQKKSELTAKSSLQADLISEISQFERSFAERKAALLRKLDDLPTEESRKQLVDTFLKDMDR